MYFARFGHLLFSFLYPMLGFVTFVYLTFFDGYVYNEWNWIIAIPVNLFLAAIWPLYWITPGVLS